MNVVVVVVLQSHVVVVVLDVLVVGPLVVVVVEVLDVHEPDPCGGCTTPDTQNVYVHSPSVWPQ